MKRANKKLQHTERDSWPSTRQSSNSKTETPNSRERNELTFSMPSCENSSGDWRRARNLIKIKSARVAVFLCCLFTFKSFSRRAWRHSRQAINFKRQTPSAFFLASTISSLFFFPKTVSWTFFYHSQISTQLNRSKRGQDEVIRWFSKFDLSPSQTRTWTPELNNKHSFSSILCRILPSISLSTPCRV